MADKTTGDLQAVPVGDLPLAPDIYDDTLIPVEQNGEAKSMTGAQWKAYGVAAAKNEADRAESAKADTQTMKEAAEKAKSDIEALAQTVASDKTAAQDAKTAAESAALTYPKIENGTWWVWDVSSGRYLNTGVNAQGTGIKEISSTQVTINGINYTRLGILLDDRNVHIVDVPNGNTPHIGENGNWWIAETDTGVPAQGDAGKGIKSIERTSGTGAAGTTDTYTITYTDGTKSTYSVYNGKNGKDGEDGYTPQKGVDYFDGEDGHTPVKGTDYWTEADKQEMVDELTEQVAPVSYNAQTLTDEQKVQARKNIGALAGSDITFGLHTDGLLYVFVDGAPVGNGVALPSGSSGDVVGNVDSANNIVLAGNLGDGTYTVKYEMADGSTIDIGELVLDSNVYYSITNSLTNCTNSNGATQVVAGEGYSATITAKDGYELSSVVVTMGGSAVTVTNGVINIASVTGDIVITAVAEARGPAYTNLLPLAVDANGNDYVGTNGEDGYKTGYKLSSSKGTESAQSGACVSGYIPIADIADRIRIKNITVSSSASINNITFHSSDKTRLYGTAGAAGVLFGAGITADENGVYSFAPSKWLDRETYPSLGFFRFSCGGITDETIVTVNEEIV